MLRKQSTAAETTLLQHAFRATGFLVVGQFDPLPNFRNGGRGGAEGLESAKLGWRRLSFD